MGDLLNDVEVEIVCDISDSFAIMLVFARKYPVPLTQQTLQMAWQVMIIPSQGQGKFIYSKKDYVGAFYYDERSQILAGPIEAEPGSSWIVTAEQKSSISLVEDDSKFTFYIDYLIFIY